MFADGPVAGQTVLVTGGAGAVGAYAIQLAKLGGARVLTTVSSDAKAEIAADAGADYVFNYRAENIVQRIADLPGGGGVDRIVEVEVGGNLEQSLAVLKPNGVLAGYASDAVLEPKVPFYGLAYKSLTMRFILVFMMPEAAKRQATAEITRWLEAGCLAPLHRAPLPARRGGSSPRAHGSRRDRQPRARHRAGAVTRSARARRAAALRGSSPPPRPSPEEERRTCRPAAFLSPPPSRRGGGNFCPAAVTVHPGCQGFGLRVCQWEMGSSATMTDVVRQ